FQTVWTTSAAPSAAAENEKRPKEELLNLKEKREPLSNSQTEEKQGREARGTSEKARKQKTEIPAEWLPHQQSMQNGEALGLSVAEIQIEAQKFRTYARQDARRSADWDAGFDNWLIRAAEYRGLKLGATPKPSGEVISFPTLPGSPQWHVWKART